MHELGIVYEIAKTVENVVEQNGLSRVEAIILQIGELSTVIPKYIRDCYPAAVDGTMLEETELKIEILPGNARCSDCGKIYNVIKNRGLCPDCGGREREILSGREFMIKEIVAC
ncbi:MAG: hydrogenase maturation nickel metallochaperone HypA [Spirochaetales bacterium]|uniref:Hydrogenase maturation factor HypA n=1 Tax=Candidatus Thalassospirochaeta sargassi TaxID=3119039 RepID=A0AAJ1MKD1_9SPIO|nr:hydrogenase maturation nickel metallochaperone HypA [Spirochaetales bacterium]